jgi:sucrose synthase
MQQLIEAVLHDTEEQTALQQIIDAMQTSEERYFLRNEILQTFADYCQQIHKPAYFFHSSSLGRLVHYTHELMLEDDSVWLILRPWIASQQIWRLDSKLLHCELKTPNELLDARDRLVNRVQPQILDIDVEPFYEHLPRISDPRSIGQGLAFLNRYLCNRVAEDPPHWLDLLFEVLHRHQYDNTPLMINDQIHSGEELAQQVKQAIKFVSDRAPDEPYETLHSELRTLGFEPGWGNNAERVQEMLELLDRLITAPEPAILEAFVARFPAAFRIVSISIHGWVGQDGSLGRPETMGQVIYVLEQARSLEQKLQQQIEQSGLAFLGIQAQVVILTRLIPNCEGTTCGLRVEKVDRTDNTWILRVPFREFNAKITDNWISKFEIFPYLEPFSLDAEQELLNHFGGTPDLIIGNYTDGNLVAYLLARRLKVTHCAIAHTLEKPKYLFSNLYWQDLEPQYHFSSQFTADVINMNAADFVVTSSYQEIFGTPDTLGQYESYKCFTMPELYHVVDGINLFSPKFNRVQPGVDDSVFFPYYQYDRRDETRRSRLNNLIFKQQDPNLVGDLADPRKRPILAIAPISVSKNLTGLIEFFGQNEALQTHCNLILTTNKIRVDEAISSEEAAELQKIHDLIEQYQLREQIRWIGVPHSTSDLGEIYRLIADRNGIFVHFARFEAFGRVVLEAMVSGLPTFATEFGGPSELIEDGHHGFLINPTDPKATADKILHFLETCDRDPEHWKSISDRGIQRIQDDYNWQHHTSQLLLLAKMYSFWNYVQRENREALLRYLDTLFQLVYKPRAATILEQHMRQ